MSSLPIRQISPLNWASWADWSGVSRCWGNAVRANWRHSSPATGRTQKTRWNKEQLSAVLLTCIYQLGQTWPNGSWVFSKFKSDCNTFPTRISRIVRWEPWEGQFSPYSALFRKSKRLENRPSRICRVNWIWSQLTRQCVMNTVNEHKIWSYWSISPWCSMYPDEATMHDDACLPVSCAPL